MTDRHQPRHALIAADPKADPRRTGWRMGFFIADCGFGYWVAQTALGATCVHQSDLAIARAACSSDAAMRGLK